MDITSTKGYMHVTPMERRCLTNFIVCLMQVAQKIISAVTWIFKTLFCCFFKKPINPLNSKQIKVLDDLKSSLTLQNPTPIHHRRASSRLWSPAPSADVSSDLNPSKARRRLDFEDPEELFMSPKAKPSETALVTTKQEVETLAVDISDQINIHVIKRYLAEPLEFIKNSCLGKTGTIQSIISFLIHKIGNNAKELSTSILSQSGKSIEPGLQSFMQWLIDETPVDATEKKEGKPVTRPVDVETLLTTLATELASKGVVAPPTATSLKSYIEPTVRALHHYTYADAKELERAPIHKILKDQEAILLEIFTSLLKNRITQFFATIESELFQNLPTIIKKVVILNGRTIAKTLAANYVEVTTNIKPFARCLDGIVQVVIVHLEAMAEAEKGAKDIIKRALSYKAKKVIPADLAVEHGQYQKIQQLVLDKKKTLKSKDPLLKDKEKLTKDEENLLHNQAELWAQRELTGKLFVLEPSCHSSIRLSGELYSEVDLAKILENLDQQNFFSQLSETIITALIPISSEPEKDGFVRILLNLQGADKLNAILKAGRQILQKALLTAPKIMDFFNRTQSAWLGAIQHVIHNYKPGALLALSKALRELLKVILTPVLRKQYQHLMHPGHLKQLMAYSILPSLKTIIFQAYAKSTLYRGLVKESHPIITLMQQLLARPEERAILTSQISALWWTALAKPDNAFSMEKSGIPKEIFYKEFVLPEIDKLVSFLVRFSKKIVDEDAFLTDTIEKIPAVQMTPVLILAGIKKYFDGTETGPKTYSPMEHHLYTTLLQTALFKIGEFPSKLGWVESGFEALSQIISTATLQSFEDLRTSPDQITQLLCNLVRDNFGTPEAVEERFHGPENWKDEKEVAAKLAEEIKQLSDLTHSYLMGAVSTTTGGHTGLKMALGKSSDALTKAISTVYEKAFGKERYTANVILQISDLVRGLLLRSAHEKRIEATA